MRSRSSASFFALATLGALTAALALGSVAAADTPAPSATTPSPAAPPPPAGTASAAPSASASAAARPATGYGYSTKPVTGGAPRPVGRVGHPVARTPVPAGPIATLPGFEMEADGSSRLFVQLTQTVQVEERVAKGQLTYVLKGAHVTVHNNQNPLETVHFNTPVIRARLVPSGSDLLFVIELRTQAAAAWKLTPAKDGSTILMVDFAKGSYLGTGAPAPSAPPPAPRPSATAAH